MPIPAANADTYLEIGFTADAGSLQPGASAIVSSRVVTAGFAIVLQKSADSGCAESAVK